MSSKFVQCPLFFILTDAHKKFERDLLGEHSLPCVLKGNSEMNNREDYLGVFIDHVIKWVDTHLSYRCIQCQMLIYLRTNRHTCSDRHIFQLQHICGSLHTHQPTITTWTLDPVTGYSIHLMFLHFDMMYSKNCSIDSLSITRIRDCQHKESYCGHLPPWNETSTATEIVIDLLIHNFSSSTGFRLMYFISKLNLMVLRKTFQFARADYPCPIRLHTHDESKFDISLTVRTAYGKLLHIAFHNLTEQANQTKPGKFMQFMFLLAVSQIWFGDSRNG